MAADGSQGETTSDAERAGCAPARAGDLLVAAALLTRFPVPVDHAAAGARAAAAVWAYPLVGAALGALAGVVLLGLTGAGVPATLAAIIAVAVGAIATGAMHEDGLADCADGIGGGWSPERRLEIMKDSSIGAYGALALIIAVLLRIAALAALAQLSAGAVLAALALAGAASRAPLGAIMRWMPNARSGKGLSASVGRPPALSAGLALALGAAILPLAFGGLPGVAAAAAGLAAAAALAWLALRKLGGQTGDVLGAAQVLAEIATLTVVLALIQA